jgi:hypothetical protein
LLKEHGDAATSVVIGRHKWGRNGTAIPAERMVPPTKEQESTVLLK